MGPSATPALQRSPSPLAQAASTSSLPSAQGFSLFGEQRPWEQRASATPSSAARSDGGCEMALESTQTTEFELGYAPSCTSTVWTDDEDFPVWQRGQGVASVVGVAGTSPSLLEGGELPQFWEAGSTPTSGGVRSYPVLGEVGSLPSFGEMSG